MRYTTNTVEDRWKRSTSDQKHVLGTDKLIGKAAH